MEREQIYIVASAWYEEYDPRYVIGPPVENWQAYCNSLLPKAVEWAIANAPCWIGWSDIVDGLVAVLESNGYRRAKPPEARYWGSCIIRDGSDDKDDLLAGKMMNKIKSHNQAIEDGVQPSEARDE